jgi:hypothetical protein
MGGPGAKPLGSLGRGRAGGCPARSTRTMFQARVSLFEQPDLLDEGAVVAGLEEAAAVANLVVGGDDPGEDVRLPDLGGDQAAVEEGRAGRGALEAEEIEAPVEDRQEARGLARRDGLPVGGRNRQDGVAAQGGEVDQPGPF